MNKLTFIPEVICILLLIFFSMMWSYSIRTHEQLNVHLDKLIVLETLSSEHKVQLLSANFNDQLHYDNFFQLQSQIERIVHSDSMSLTLKPLVNRYIELSMSYMQLVTMIRTSKRLLGQEHEQAYNQKPMLLNMMKVKIFNYIHSSNQANKSAAYDAILKVIKDPNAQGTSQYSQYLQLFKLHSLFILDNYETTIKYRRELMDIPIKLAILTSISQQHTKIIEMQYKRYVSILCSLLSIIFLFYIAFKREQYSYKRY